MLSMIRILYMCLFAVAVCVLLPTGARCTPPTTQLDSDLSRRVSQGGTSLARSSTLQTRAVTASYLASEAPEQQPASPAGQ